MKKNILLLPFILMALSFCRQNDYATKSDIEELKKEIKADIEKTIKGTVYCLISLNARW